MTNVSSRHVAVVILGLVVFLAVILQLLYPNTHRNDIAIDRQIVEDFYELEGLVRNFYISNDDLPVDLKEIGADEELAHRIDALKYSYKANASSFELCALFRTEGTTDDDFRILEPFGVKSNFLNTVEDIAPGLSAPHHDDRVANHSFGQQCYTYELESNGIFAPEDLPTKLPIDDFNPDTFSDFGELLKQYNQTKQ